MYDKNPIGKKVNLLNKVSVCTYEMSKETYEVVGVIPWSKELHDWCQHYIVRGADGTEKEIRECECVSSPDYTKETTALVFDFLYKNGVYAEVYKFNGIALCVDISWGDWKHDHLWARDLMEYLGYKEMGSKVTEENGSDCYSAEHYFIKTSA